MDESFIVLLGEDFKLNLLPNPLRAPAWGRARKTLNMQQATPNAEGRWCGAPWALNIDR
jgi:hypothetical protein